MKKIIFLVITIILMLFILTACNNQPEEVIVELPDIAGIVTEVGVEEMSILVESITDVVNGQIWVTINEDTTFGLGVSSDFAVDNYVEISADEGIMESDPMQAVASMVCTNEIQ